MLDGSTRLSWPAVCLLSKPLAALALRSEQPSQLSTAVVLTVSVNNLGDSQARRQQTLKHQRRGLQRRGHRPRLQAHEMEPENLDPSQPSTCAASTTAAVTASGPTCCSVGWRHHRSAWPKPRPEQPSQSLRGFSGHRWRPITRPSTATSANRTGSRCAEARAARTPVQISEGPSGRSKPAEGP